MHRSTSGFPLIAATAALTAADQEEFIYRNSDVLACFGYAHYRDAGRGFIALFPELFFQQPGQLGAKDLFYFTRGELLSTLVRWKEDTGAPDAFFRQVRATVETYDPSTSIVISFLSLHYAGERVQTYLVDTVTPPPLAYAAYTN